MKPFPALTPVFVDATGRRHRTIRRFGALLAVPAVAYLVLLGSSLLGGPRLDTPLVPLPEAAKQHTGPGPRVPPATNQPTDTPRTEENPGSAPTSERSTQESISPEPTEGPTTVASSPGATPSPAVNPTATAPVPVPTTPTMTPTATPTPTPTVKTPGHGKPTTTPPGRTKTPSKP